MTQAFNLAQLANAVDTSGRLNVGTNATGTLPVANGGTGTSSPSLVAGSGISISGSFPNQTITNTSSATGTVTSVATGNGLQGGTITTSGTLSVACPGFNTVGSYIFCEMFYNSVNISNGGNYSAGNGNNQIRSFTGRFDGGYANTTDVSGTWKWMGAFAYSGVYGLVAIACRVS